LVLLKVVLVLLLSLRYRWVIWIKTPLLDWLIKRTKYAHTQTQRAVTLL